MNGNVICDQQQTVCSQFEIVRSSMQSESERHGFYMLILALTNHMTVFKLFNVFSHL